MAGELKLFYSSGSGLTDEFSKDPSESIGGGLLRPLKLRMG